MGQTHPVVLKANKFNCYINPLFKREVCGGDFETTIQRSQWGVIWGLQFGFEERSAAGAGRGDQRCSDLWPCSALQQVSGTSTDSTSSIMRVQKSVSGSSTSTSVCRCPRR